MFFQLFKFEDKSKGGLLGTVFTWTIVLKQIDNNVYVSYLQYVDLVAIL